MFFVVLETGDGLVELDFAPLVLELHVEALVGAGQVSRTDQGQTEFRIGGRPEEVLVLEEASGLEGRVLGVLVKTHLFYAAHLHLPVQLEHLQLRSFAYHLLHVGGQEHVHPLLHAVLVTVHVDHLAHRQVHLDVFRGGGGRLLGHGRILERQPLVDLHHTFPSLSLVLPQGTFQFVNLGDDLRFLGRESLDEGEVVEDLLVLVEGDYLVVFVVVEERV